MNREYMAPKMGPERAPNGPPTEDVEQNALRKHLDALELLWFHVPNGELRNPVTAARLCSLGVKRGVPDVIIITPPPKRPQARGVAIELKRRVRGRVSPDQQKWLNDLSNTGWVTAVCRGFEEAHAFLVELGWSLDEATGGVSCSTK